MIRATLSGMLSRKLRTVLTAISILLGVAMMSGTFVMTDTIRHAFDSIFTSANKNTSAVIMGKTAVTSLTGQNPPLADSVLQAARKVPDVAVAEGNIQDTAKILDAKGHEIGGNGPPQFGFSLSSPRFNPLELVNGHWPQTSDQVVIDKKHRRRPPLGPWLADPHRHQAADAHLRRDRRRALPGRRLAWAVPRWPIFDTRNAQQLFDKQGKWDEISLAAKPGVSEAQLVTALKDAHLPSDVPLDIKTATQNTTDNVNMIGTAISFLTYALLAFGAIALFVGAFIIFNTFSITVAQRTRELAMMRALGGTRRQVMAAVLSEAVVIGVVSSLIGLVGGVLLGKGMISLFAALGIDLPHTGTIVATRTIVVGAARRHRRDGRRLRRAGLARDPRAARRRAARGRDAAARPPAPLHALHRRRDRPALLAALAYGLLGNPGSTTPACRSSGSAASLCSSPSRC